MENKNSEGYKDPTAADAMKQADQEAKELMKRKKKFLWSYQDIGKDIARIENDIRKLKCEMDGLKAIQYTGMPKGNACSSGIAEYVSRLGDLEALYWQMQADRVQRKTEIETAIFALKDERQKIILRLRYMNRMDWFKISCLCNLSRSVVMDTHSNALIKLKLNIN